MRTQACDKCGAVIRDDMMTGALHMGCGGRFAHSTPAPDVSVEALQARVRDLEALNAELQQLAQDNAVRFMSDLVGRTCITCGQRHMRTRDDVTPLCHACAAQLMLLAELSDWKPGMSAAEWIAAAPSDYERADPLLDEREVLAASRRLLGDDKKDQGGSNG